MVPAVFLDKDGTLIPDIPYNVDPERMALYPETGPALQRLQQAGYRLLVVSNQSGVARGYFAEEALPAVFDKLNALLTPFGVVLDGFAYCANHPGGSVKRYAIDCDRRKPKPGMLLELAIEHGIDQSASWMIGDMPSDVAAGNQAGCQTILLDRNHETHPITGPFDSPTATVGDLTEAADLILGTSRMNAT